MKKKKIICICIVAILMIVFVEKSIFFHGVATGNLTLVENILALNPFIINQRKRAIDLGWDLTGSNQTALIVACSNGDSEMIDLLIEKRGRC